jgi:hypothetical protein
MPDIPANRRHEARSRATSGAACRAFALVKP